MMERFLVVLGQVVSLFLLMGVGFALGKMKLLTPAGTKEMSALLLNFVTPCVVLNAFQIEYDAAFLKTMGIGMAGMALCYLIFIGMTHLFFRHEPSDTQDTLRFGAMYGNVGYMGIPLVANVLGGNTVIYAVMGIIVFNLVVFSHGAMLMGGRKAVSLKRSLLSPALISATVGFVMMLARIRFPAPIQQAVGSMAGINTAVAMCIIGNQLSRSDLAAVFRQPKLYEAAAIKQILVPVVTAAVLLPFHMDPTLYIAIVILLGAPTAGFTSIFAERYGRDVAYAAQLVSLSTILSVITLPLVAVMAEVLAG